MLRIYHCDHSLGEAEDLMSLLHSRGIGASLVQYNPLTPTVKVQAEDIIFCGFGKSNPDFILHCHRIGCCTLKPEQSANNERLVKIRRVSTRRQGKFSL